MLFGYWRKNAIHSAVIMDGDNNNNESGGLRDFTNAIGSHNVDTGGLGSDDGENQGFNRFPGANQGFGVNQGYGMPQYQFGMNPYNVYNMPPNTVMPPNTGMAPYNVYMPPNVGANQGFGMPPNVGMQPYVGMHPYHGSSGPVPNQPYGGSGPVHNEEANAQGEEEGEQEGEEEEEIDPKQVMDFTAGGYPLNRDNYSRFVSFIGDVAREKVPITHENWRNFFKDHPELAKTIWRHIRVNLLFKISTQNECIKND